jgi:hypothetical protein
MFNHSKITSGLFLLAFALIAGCSGGGGGGSSAPATTSPTTTFPFASAGSTQTANGWSKTFTATTTGTATCSGSGTINVSPANTATTFAITPTNTVSALSGTQTVTLTWTNCTPTSSASNVTFYVNPSTYDSYGAVKVGTFYNVYLTAPVTPTTVKIGDSGIIGTINQYTDSTETVSDGLNQVSYTVSADTPTTVIINIINTTTGSTANSTEIAKYKLSTTGVITPISDTVSITSGVNNGLNETWTYN